MDQVGEIVKYILYRCRENNTPLTEIMAFFVAQTILNPSTQSVTQGPKDSISRINCHSPK